MTDTTTITTNILSEFYDVPACVFTKDDAVVSVALGKNSHDAYMKAVDANPEAIIGASVGFSKEIDEKSKKLINACKHEIIKINCNLKDYKKTVINETLDSDTDAEDARILALSLDKDTFKIATKTAPTAEQIEDAIFGWKISKYLKKNSVVIAKDFKTVSLFQGENDINNMIEKALDYGCENTKNSSMSLSFDELTPHIINACVQARVGVLIYSGGNINDKEFIKLADKYNLAILTTGIMI